MEVAAAGWSLPAAAAGVAVIHTVLGPDHYLPFGVLARARGWSLAQTLLITTACGLGHVFSSLALGLGLISLGFAGTRLTEVDAGRGDLAAWGLIIFGLGYAVWGLLRARRGQGHATPKPWRGMTFWTLFLVFVLGPCEPLVPLLLVPASEGRWDIAATAAAAFTTATLLTMLGLTLAAWLGLERLRLGGLEPWAHTLAGCVVAGAGLAIRFLGL